MTDCTRCVENPRDPCFDAERKEFVAMIPLLKAYLDESSDEKREDVFCVGAFLANEHYLKAMQDAWAERLKTPDEIPYFRATACKGVHEPFFKLRKSMARTHKKSQINCAPTLS